MNESQIVEKIQAWKKKGNMNNKENQILPEERKIELREKVQTEIKRLRQMLKKKKQSDGLLANDRNFTREQYNDKWKVENKHMTQDEYAVKWGEKLTEVLNEEVYTQIIGDHIGKNIHEKLVKGYGELQNNPDALKKLNNYYVAFQEESYTQLKKEYPEFDKNIFRRIFLSGFITWIQRPGNTILHESGHYNTAKRQGYSPYLGYEDHEGEDINGITVLEQFIATLLGKGRAHVGYGNSQSGGSSIIDSMERAGNGINQNTQYGKDIYEDILYENNGYSFIKNISMNSNRLYGLGYILTSDETRGDDDIANYMKDMNIKNGTDYTKYDLRNYALLSVLSGSTLSGIKDGFGYVFKGKNESELIGFDTKFGKVMLPEFNTWLSKNGVSVEMSQYLRTKTGGMYSIGFDTGVMGNDSQTMIFGLHKNVNGVHMKGGLSIGDNNGFELGGSGKLDKNVQWYGKAGYAQNENMFDRGRGEGGYGEVGIAINF